MPFTRSLVVSQVLIGLVSDATELSEDNIFTHISLKEQGVTDPAKHLLLLILINANFSTNIAYHPKIVDFSVLDWVNILSGNAQVSDMAPQKYPSLSVQG